MGVCVLERERERTFLCVCVCCVCEGLLADFTSRVVVGGASLTGCMPHCTARATTVIYTT